MSRGVTWVGEVSSRGKREKSGTFDNLQQQLLQLTLRLTLVTAGSVGGDLLLSLAGTHSGRQQHWRFEQKLEPAVTRNG